MQEVKSSCNHYQKESKMPPRVPVWSEWNPVTRIISVSDNERIIEIPILEQWQILGIFVDYIADATVGNREIVLAIETADGEYVGLFAATPVIAASQTRGVEFVPGVAQSTDFVDLTSRSVAYATIPPSLVLPGTTEIQISDVADISASDTMTIALLIAVRMND